MTTLRARVQGGPTSLLAACCLALLFVLPALADEAAKATSDAEAAPAGEEQDETKQLLSQLTIAMVAEVIDETTIEIRDSGKSTGESKGKRRNMHIKLGNVKLVRKGAAHSDEEHAARRSAAKEALTSLVSKQMIWWKAAPDEHQLPPPAEESKDPQVVLGDVWMIDGKHINSLMSNQGHVDRETKYHSDLARNILTAESDEKKKDSYAELERALKESEKEKKKIMVEEVQKEQEKEKQKDEPIGAAGWIGLALVGVIIIAAVGNFGREKKKKVNLNRKRGMFEKFWTKLKGS